MAVNRLDAAGVAAVVENAQQCTVVTAGQAIHITYGATRGISPPTRKIDKDHYVDTRTGELHEYKHTKSRADAIRGVQRSINRLRLVIDANTNSKYQYLWVTLTYHENVRDVVRVYADYKRYNTRLRRKIGHYEYIAAIEPQARGAWHLHVLMIWQQTQRPYIPPHIVAGAWGQGYVKIHKVDKVSDIANYLCSYLTNTCDVMPDGTYNTHKGARLHLYPPGINIYRTSRGIAQPTKAAMAAADVDQMIQDMTCTYTAGYSITDAAGQPTRRIVNRRYIPDDKQGQ